MEKILEKTGALLKGHFSLTSGKHSDTYIQCAKILQHPRYAEQLAQVVAEDFKNENIDIVIGPAMGGMIFAYEVARQLDVINMFTERDNGVMTLRRGFEIPKGARVLVAEDVITTGGSVHEVIDIVNISEGIVVGVCVLVDRSGGSSKFPAKLKAAYTASVKSYEKDECPICKEGKLPAVKPGSRVIR